MFLHSRHSAFLPIAPISRPAASARCLFSANGPDYPPLRPLSKTLQPAFAAFCPVSKLHPFFAPCIFFSTNQPSCKIAPIFTFFIYLQKSALFACAAILRAFLAFLFLRVPFQKTVPLLRVPKIRLYFNHTKRGGIFHFKPPKQHLKLKFIFLKSTQNLWKGFRENLTMCHILPHFAGKQCAFFN